MTTPQMKKIVTDFGLNSKTHCVGLGMAIGLSIGVVVGKTAAGIDLNSAIAIGTTAGIIVGVGLFSLVKELLKPND
jgi:hypothetical protein